ncbi:MAG: hypothetical protein NC299_15665 [Lachnospiraceae bacterium]|nr:hypothetical protein [Ruminococcus sp.]MCM1276771.1 hypothetical protein [Lachnospiraceae bacterium]
MSLEMGCNQCLHFAVCNSKDSLAALKASINDLAKLMENQNFTVDVKCKFYDNRQVKLRSRQGDIQNEI